MTMFFVNIYLTQLQEVSPKKAKALPEEVNLTTNHVSHPDFELSRQIYCSNPEKCHILWKETSDHSDPR